MEESEHNVPKKSKYFSMLLDVEESDEEVQTKTKVKKKKKRNHENDETPMSEDGVPKRKKNKKALNEDDNRVIQLLFPEKNVRKETKKNGDSDNDSGTYSLSSRNMDEIQRMKPKLKKLHRHTNKGTVESVKAKDCSEKHKKRKPEIFTGDLNYESFENQLITSKDIKSEPESEKNSFESTMIGTPMKNKKHSLSVKREKPDFNNSVSVKESTSQLTLREYFHDNFIKSEDTSLTSQNLEDNDLVEGSDNQCNESLLSSSKRKKKKKTKKRSEESVGENISSSHFTDQPIKTEESNTPKKKTKRKVEESDDKSDGMERDAAFESLKNHLLKKRRKLLGMTCESNDEFTEVNEEEVAVDSDREERTMGCKSVSEYFNSIGDECEMEFNEECLSEINQLHITVPWPVPMQHMIETRMSSVPTKKQQEKFAEMGVTFKTGPFTKAEDEILERNWKEFCKFHDLEENPAPFLQLQYKNKNILRNTERIKFVRFLAKDLKDRKLYTIYKHFQRLFANRKKGKFAREEDKDILAMQQKKNAWSALAKKYNRPRECIRNRFTRLLSEKPDYHKSDTHTKLENLWLSIKEVLDIQDHKELYNREITKREWKHIARNLKTSVDDVKKTWLNRLYPGLFATQPHDIRRDALKRLIKSGVDDWAVIDWNKIAEKHEGVTGIFIREKVRKLIRRIVAKEDRQNVQATLKTALEYLDKLYHNYRNARYFISDGRLFRKK